MALIRCCLLCLLVVFSLSAQKIFAKSVSLKTISTSVPSTYGVLLAEIHFDERDALIAQKTQDVITNDLIKVINYFQYVPRSIVHFNVDPYMRLPNGNARVFTNNVINLYNFPSNNADHLIVMEDWLKGLIVHEYIHITHLDQTRGYLEVGRQIFGSIAKLPANIVPRWFSEGIAVWGESHLLSGGRLNSSLFRKELLIQFLREEYCDSIDCLDDPGVYPQGQLAYWAGSHFIEYLENKKPGTIRCLVEFNSSEIPFFLNKAFRYCSGEEAQYQFSEFKADFIREAHTTVSSKETWGDKISNAFGSDDFQKGVILDGNMLYKVERDRYTEALVSYDLSDSNSMSLITQKYSLPISDLSGPVTLPNIDGEPTRYLLVSFIEDPRYRKENKVWKLVNAETLMIERSLALKNDPSYVLPLGNNTYISASYLDNRWKLEKQILGEKDLVSGVELLYQFAPLINLNSLQMAGQKIFLKTNDGKESTLAVSDLSLTFLKTLYTSEKYFEVPVVHENFLVIDEKGKQRLIEFSNGVDKATYSVMGKDLLKNVTMAQVNNERVLFLENRLKTKAMNLQESLAFLKTNQTETESKTLAAFSPSAQEQDLSTQKTEKYPQLYHLSPTYWFLATGSGENISSIGAMTTLNDPMDLHLLNATVLLYPSISKGGGNLDYIHKFSSIDDLWSMNAFANQEYSRTEINDTLKETRGLGIGTSYTFLLKKWTEIPGIFFNTTTDKDFISHRTTNSVGFRNILFYDALSFNDLFQSVFTQLKLQSDNPNIGNTFLNFQARLITDLRFSDRLSGEIKTAYGKLFKHDFSRGVLYGGGTNTVANQRWFEFYGVPYSNAYGNEIFTFRLQGDYNFWNIYRGYQFFPVFLKEAHLLVGRESLYADRIFLDNSLIREKAVNALFLGLRLEANLFYYVPTNMDFIYSSTSHPNGKNIEQVNFTINAELF